MRKEAYITIRKEGIRDDGKVFYIREMPAMQAEKWATKALMAILRSGADIPDNIASQGLAGVAQMGIPALIALNFADVEPLLDEMLTCIQVVANPDRPQVKRRLTANDDIEEVATLMQLREEILSMHLGFSLGAALSTSTRGQGTETTANMQNIETFPQPLAS
jgi:hypothetical protein